MANKTYNHYHRKYLQLFSNILEAAFSWPPGQTHHLFKRRCFLSHLQWWYWLWLAKYAITRCYGAIMVSHALNLTKYFLTKRTCTQTQRTSTPTMMQWDNCYIEPGTLPDDPLHFVHDLSRHPTHRLTLDSEVPA